MNKIDNRIVLKIEAGYILELQSKGTMKSLGRTGKNINKYKDSDHVPNLETVEVVLTHCNLVNNSYQQPSKLLLTFVPNNQFRQLINISPNSLIMLNTANTEFSFIDVWFTDQNGKPLEIEDNVNMALLLGNIERAKNILHLK